MTIPSELVLYKQWVLWQRIERNGRPTKRPLSPWTGRAAACDRPKTWSSFRHASYARHKYQADGIGFVFTEADPFCGIDLDNCRSAEGALTPKAQAILSRLRSYTELSPSGSGLHLIVKAKLPGAGRRHSHVEIYDAGRYFTITGHHLADTPLRIEDRQLEIDQLLANEFPQAAIGRSEALTREPILNDDELIAQAMKARNGKRFASLWKGDVSDYDGDHSRADAALCSLLAFWTDDNHDRIDRLFRRSGLMRDKWDRSAGSTTYANRTIQTILKSRSA